MAVAVGARLGPYEILSALGAGGMGEVYRARDRKLGRDVALKILPDAFASDPDRLARFTREAQTLAALNHPNIAHIHSLEESAGVRALVMELVEGEDLAQRLARGPIPLDEALPIAKQIVEALEAAHEHGIIHRDLKPANIKLRPDGTVKVLDFGLAKALGLASASADSAQSPTITSPAVSRMGVILGTAAYMSPEQAKGRPADKRSDVWAFGCVLFEMITGHRAFAGEDVPDTLAFVLTKDPDWSLLPTPLPLPIRSLLQGCLEKDRNVRIADISTARFLMNGQRLAGEAIGPAPIAVRRLRWTRAALLVAIGATTGGAVAWNMRPSGKAASPTRFSITLGEDQRFTNVHRRLVAISGDGTRLIYVANQRLYLRPMSDLEARPIAGTESSAAVTNPTFSPDGRSVAFWSGSDQTLKRVGISGGSPVTICKATMPLGMEWSSDGLVFGQANQNIMRVSADGGTPELLIHVNSDESPYSPQTLPDGRGTLFTLASASADSSEWTQRIMLQTSGQGEPRTLIENAGDGRYLTSGHIVYVVEGKLFAVSFDLRSLRVTSKPVLVVDGIARGDSFIRRREGVAHFAVSESGSLVYIPGPPSTAAPQFDLALLDRTGRIKSLKLKPGPYEFPRVSPDGRQVALGIDDGKEANVWIYDLSGTSAMRRLTFGGRNRFPVWSANGQHVAFQSDREGDLAIFWQRADNSGSAERLTKPDGGTSHIPESWSPRDVLSFSARKGSRFSLQVLSLRDKRVTSFSGVESAVLADSAFSPDGQWLAYQSGDWVPRGRPNRVTAYVEPFPPTGTKQQISEGSGFHQSWSRDGGQLFYVVAPGQWFAVSVTKQTGLIFGKPNQVPGMELPVVVGKPPLLPRNNDMTPAGDRIVVIPSEGAGLSTRNMYVVLNWLEELKARVTTK